MAAITDSARVYPSRNPGFVGKLVGARSRLEAHEAKWGYIFLLPWLLGLIVFWVGPFPMPYNLRFQELQDNWANTSPDLFYGDVAFEEGLQTVQDTMQEILDLDRA